MFSYVAKSLLSKTLRTFLRKYLENIELEGLDYGGTNAENSQGWGVRLSNVKLREGMVLMKLPGKRKLVAKRGGEKKKSKRTKGSVANDTTPVTKNTKKVLNMKDFIGVDGGEHSSHSLRPKYNGASSPERESQSAETSSLHEEIEQRDRLTSECSGYFSSGPSTPTQTRHGVCGVPSVFCLDAKSTRRLESHHGASVGVPFNGQTFDDDTSLREKQASQEIGSHGRVDISSASYVFDADNDDGVSSIEDEEGDVVEDNLELVVGAGGMIGTLNIRMVGKELHITVEDAHLIVEAIPRDPDEVIAETDVLKGDESQKSAQPPKMPSEGDLTGMVFDEGGEPTIGEKIKAKSKLARYLSMIPHLFLRDCRVSLILPEETVGAESARNDSSCDDCTVFEMGINFLSVTSGDDFMDVLRFDTGNQSPAKKQHGLRRSRSTGKLGSKGDERSGIQNNLFSRKRVRTGKGPEGGLWLKVYPPQNRIPRLSQKLPSKPKWARQHYLDSSESFFFRCSGIDLHARFLTQTHVEQEEGNLLGNEYEDMSMDSMLFGVDYIDPVSLTRHQINNIRKGQKTNPSEGVSDQPISTDENGIHAIPFASNNFHWAAQRVHCIDCPNNESLPLNECFHCWNKYASKKPMSSSPMNNLLPLPGFVLCLSMSDPLELNVDRNGLESLEYAKSLFTSEKPASGDGNGQKIARDSTKDAVGFDYGERNNVASISILDDGSFPEYMQPDAIYLSGLHINSIIVRVEDMQPRTSGLKFRFWQFVGKSIHFELSQVDCEEQQLKDATLQIGALECRDFSGVCVKNILLVDRTKCHNEGIHLPCNASRVLGVPSSVGKSCAVYIKMIRSGLIGEKKVGYIQLRSGVFTINVEATLKDDVFKAFGDAKKIFSSGGSNAETEKTVTKKSNLSSPLWLIQVSTDGGELAYEPKRIRAKLPGAEFRMTKGGKGFSLETILQGIQLNYGPYMYTKPTPPSIISLCSLPETVRMNILLNLDDLTSLEEVFSINKKKKPSAFLRTHALNKKMSLIAKSGASRTKGTLCSQSEANRRSTILSQLQSLNTDALEALLATHGRSKNQ